MLAMIGNSSADASYFARVLLIWIFTITAVATVVWPKIVKAIKNRRGSHKQHGERMGRRGAVSSIFTLNGSSTYGSSLTAAQLKGSGEFENESHDTSTSTTAAVRSGPTKIRRSKSASDADSKGYFIEEYTWIQRPPRTIEVKNNKNYK